MAGRSSSPDAYPDSYPRQAPPPEPSLRGAGRRLRRSRSARHPTPAPGKRPAGSPARQAEAPSNEPSSLTPRAVTGPYLEFDQSGHNTKDSVGHSPGRVSNGLTQPCRLSLTKPGGVLSARWVNQPDRGKARLAP